MLKKRTLQNREPARVATGMADAFGRTFAVLNKSRHAHVVDVLLAALNVPGVRYRQAAVAGLIESNSTRGHLEVFRQYPRFSAEQKAIVQGASPVKVSTALRQGILSGGQELKQTCLQLAEQVEAFDVLSALINVLREFDGEWTDQVAAVLHSLVNRLYEYSRQASTASTPNRRPPRNLNDLIVKLITELDAACARLNDMTYLPDLVEGILILGSSEHFIVEKTLVQGTDRIKKIAARLLSESTHPGILDLICNSMSRNYPFAEVREAFQIRRDPEFICCVLRWLPIRLDAACQKNLRQIRALNWIEPDQPQLALIPPGLQERLVRFVRQTGLAEDLKMDVYQWLIQRGSADGRLAAADAIAELDQSDVKEIIYEGLESEDVEVKAWAATQLRSQKVPDASARLVQLLDSSDERVRDAARDQLSSFNVEFMLKNYENISPQICERAGQVIQKINPDSISQLVRELFNPNSNRRISAAHAASKMGLIRNVVPAVIEMLDDNDPLVRRAGVDVLADVPSQSVRSSVATLVDDPSPRVRDAVAHTLKQIDEELAGRMATEQAGSGSGRVHQTAPGSPAKETRR